MTDDDYPAYAALMDQIANRYYYDVSDDQIRQDFAALKKYRLVDVTWAYLEHRHHTTRGRWMPRPQDVLQRLETPPRPGTTTTTTTTTTGDIT